MIGMLRHNINFEIKFMIGIPRTLLALKSQTSSHMLQVPFATPVLPIHMVFGV